MSDDYGRMHYAKQRLKHCFTLLEMLLAMVIFALVMASVGITTRGVVNSWRKIDSHSKNIREFRQIEDLTNNTFRNAIAFRWEEPRGGGLRFLFSGTENELMFAYSHRIGLAREGGLRFLRLYLDQDHNLIAEYRPQPMMPERPQDSEQIAAGDEEEVETLCEREILQPDVESLRFLYADYSGDSLEWETEWDGDEKLKLPVAIQMEIIGVNGEKEVWLRRIGGNTQYRRMLDTLE